MVNAKLVDRGSFRGREAENLRAFTGAKCELLRLQEAMNRKAGRAK